MKLKNLPKEFTGLFTDRASLIRFLRSVKRMPQPENVQAPKLVEDYALFWRSGWNLIYYEAHEGSYRTRMLSLRTNDLHLSRRIRDAVVESTGTRTAKFVTTGARGARWMVENMLSMEGVKVSVSVRGPRRWRRFSSTGSMECVDKALAWRTAEAQAYLSKE